MLVEVKVPQLSESVSEGTLLAWHKKEGDFVAAEENLVDLETDKVVLEITAPNAGVIKQIVCKDQETVVADQLLAVIDTEAKAEAKPSAEVVPIAQVESKPAVQEQAAAAASSAVRAGPATRKRAREKQVDLGSVEGSGPRSTITMADVEAPVDERIPAAASIPVAASIPATGDVGDREEQRVPMSRLRARIAERLKQAQETAAILTTFNEVDMKPVMELRGRYQDRFVKEYGVKLGFMSFFTKAVIEALKKFPILNASVDGEDIIYHGYYDIGIAVGGPRGLVVPILRNADRQSFADIEKNINLFGSKARDGKLSMDDLLGGTFTISNGGIFGSMLSTPILNPPQSAILGMHKIQERPVVENGQIVIRPMMYLALSYDHRIIDGHDAVLFLVAVKEALEDPSRMLLQI